MGASCEEEAVGIQNQFMAKIIEHISTFGVLHIEELIAFGQGVKMRNMCHDVDTIGNHSRQSFIYR